MTGEDDEFDELSEEREIDEDESIDHYDPRDYWTAAEIERDRQLADKIEDVNLNELFRFARNPLRDDQDYEQFVELQRRKSATLLSAFQSNNITLKCKRGQRLHLRLLKERLFDFTSDQSNLYRDRGDAKTDRSNTVEPVELLIKAVKQLADAFNACSLTAKKDVPPGQLNIARVFHDRFYRESFPRTYEEKVYGKSNRTLSEFDLFQHTLNHIAFAAGGALHAGIEKPDTRPPNYLYSRFVLLLAKLCQLGGNKIEDDGSPTTQFVKLVRDCEPILPLGLQTHGDLRKAKRRVESAFERRKEMDSQKGGGAFGKMDWPYNVI
jgi:hypothetical protein